MAQPGSDFCDKHSKDVLLNSLYEQGRLSKHIPTDSVNDALLYIKATHNGEIPYLYGSTECAKLMTNYAKHYHALKLKVRTSEIDEAANEDYALQKSYDRKKGFKAGVNWLIKHLKF